MKWQNEQRSSLLNFLKRATSRFPDYSFRGVLAELFRPRSIHLLRFDNSILFTWFTPRIVNASNPTLPSLSDLSANTCEGEHLRVCGYARYRRILSTVLGDQNQSWSTKPPPCLSAKYFGIDGSSWAGVTRP